MRHEPQATRRVGHRRLRDVVAAPVDINGVLISVTMTIGHVWIDPAGADNPAALLESADAAMYRLKP